MRLRQVKYKAMRSGIGFPHDGYFHKWQNMRKEIDTDKLFGVVEMEDGEILLVPFYCIKFVNKPRIKNKTVVDRLEAIE